MSNPDGKLISSPTNGNPSTLTSQNREVSSKPLPFGSANEDDNNVEPMSTENATNGCSSDAVHTENGATLVVKQENIVSSQCLEMGISESAVDKANPANLEGGKLNNDAINVGPAIDSKQSSEGLLKTEPALHNQEPVNEAKVHADDLAVKDMHPCECRSDSLMEPNTQSTDVTVDESTAKTTIAAPPSNVSSATEEKISESKDAEMNVPSNKKRNRGSRVIGLESAKEIAAKSPRGRKKAQKLAKGAQTAKQTADDAKRAKKPRILSASKRKKTEQPVQASTSGSDEDCTLAALSKQRPTPSASRVPPRTISSLVLSDSDTSMLSVYSNFLVHNVEFFYPSKSGIKYGELRNSAKPDVCLGVRCIHCKMNPQKMKDASFFPSSIDSIASDIETIGSRHFKKNKCINSQLQRQMAEIKSRQDDIRSLTGRISLNSYCKDFAASNGIVNGEAEGIYLEYLDSSPSNSNSSSAEPEEPTDKLQIQLTSKSDGRTNETTQVSNATKTKPNDSVSNVATSSLVGRQELSDPSPNAKPKEPTEEHQIHLPLERSKQIIQESLTADSDLNDSASKVATQDSTNDETGNRRRSTRERKSVINNEFVSFGDNDAITFDNTGFMWSAKRSAAPDKPSSSEKDEQTNRRKRAKKNNDSNASKDNVGAKPSSGSLESAPSGPENNPPMISKCKVDNKSRTKGIDPQVLSSLANHSSTTPYYEESAYRFHNPPFPENGPEQLAVVRPCEISGKMEPVDRDKLDAIPPPSPLLQFPMSDHCVWSFDESTRVLLANFSAPASKNDREVVITREDEAFLLKMMERDDITLISEGLANKITFSLLGRDYIKGCIGSQYHHKVKHFKKTITKSRGRNCNLTGETTGRYEEKDWHSMKFEDYFNYLDFRQQSQNGRNETNDETFTFIESEGKETKVDPSNDVLYMLDLDMPKMLPRAYEDFASKFKLPNILPGGKHCMMNSVNVNGRPFMGPNIYMTPPSSFTPFHQDGHGTVDSGHLCIRGYNEVVMLRRLPERHKHHALHLLQGTPSSSNSFLYGKPHDQETELWWPTNAAIEECRQMGYCPSVFILKPNQLVHINKGRLHAFRKLSSSSLYEADCHYALRQAILPSIHSEDLTCLSVAWDWMFKGVTSEGINREVSSILECARLNQKHKVQSLAIPETALLFLARDHLALLKTEGNMLSDGLEPDSTSVLRGILPSLQYIIHMHDMTEEASKSWAKGGKHKKVSIDPMPNTAQNPDSFSLDPHGSGDFICKFCSDELSNLYMHCDGCERLLSKDFNICTSCHSNQLYKAQIRMHPHEQKMKSILNHTGNMKFRRTTHCPCHNGPQCRDCKWCIGCSCICHQHFTLHYRFMSVQEERKLLQEAVTAVGDSVLSASLETKVRLFSLVSDDFEVPIEAFANDGFAPAGESSSVGIQKESAHSSFDSEMNPTAEATENSANTSTTRNASTAISDRNETAEVIVASVEVNNVPPEVTHSKQSSSSNNIAAKNEELEAHQDPPVDGDTDPISQEDLDALKPGTRVVIYRQQPNADTEYWNATIIKRGSNKKDGQFQIRFDGQKRTRSEWVTGDEIARLL